MNLNNSIMYINSLGPKFGSNCTTISFFFLKKTFKAQCCIFATLGLEGLSALYMCLFMYMYMYVDLHQYMYIHVHDGLNSQGIHLHVHNSVFVLQPMQV